MGRDIPRLHHVGHVVDDMAAALTLYRRLGFAVPPPSYPAMAPREGAPPEAFGAANTHADFPRNFVELVTCVKAGGATRIPSDAKLVPLQAPAELLPQLVERIGNTSANIASYLERFQGLHILMFESADVDATAARLSVAGVAHGGENVVQRPVEVDDGVRLDSLRYLEIDGDEPGSVPEGRVGVAGKAAWRQRQQHPNGAVELVDVVLCVADTELAVATDRYERYLDRTPRREGAARIFDLDATTVTVVPESGLATMLPGERAAALPAFVAYKVAVRDISVGRDLVRANGFPVQRSASGDVFVPARAALGAAVVFGEAATA